MKRRTCNARPMRRAKGMEEKSREFKTKGSQIYLDAG